MDLAITWTGTATWRIPGPQHAASLSDLVTESPTEETTSVDFGTATLQARMRAMDMGGEKWEDGERGSMNIVRTSREARHAQAECRSHLDASCVEPEQGTAAAITEATVAAEWPNASLDGPRKQLDALTIEEVEARPKGGSAVLAGTTAAAAAARALARRMRQLNDGSSTTWRITG